MRKKPRCIQHENGTAVISVRVKTELYTILKARASVKGQSLSEYLTSCLVYISKQNGTTPAMTSTTMTATPSLILYDSKTHKAGDRVLVRQGRQIIEAVVPDMDLDGRKIPVMTI